MTKHLLIPVLVLIFISSFAQQRHVTDHMKPANAVLCPASPAPDGSPAGNTMLPVKKKSYPEQIGDTYYDTQTYNSGNLMNRMYQYPDETIGATWMHKGANGTPDRGTAYSYFSGSSWTPQDPHLGSDPNNAFPSYAPWGPNGEVIVHYRYLAGDGFLKILTRETKGQGAWTEQTLTPPEGNYSLVWHSMITSGQNHEYIHILALVYDDPYMGQEDALLYYRSSDGGLTWDINGEIIDGLGVDFYPTIPSLHYSWALPVGNTLAFTFGFNEFDGLVFKSSDNGDNWQKIVVYDSPYEPYDVPDITPTFGCCDGTSAIALDNNGKVHVAFGRMLRFHDVVTTPPGGWYYYPTVTEGLMYWNEDMPALDSTIVSSYTLDYLQAGGNLIGWIVPETATLNIVSGQPDYGLGLTSQPQLCVGPGNEIFVLYAGISPDNLSADYYYRHIYSNMTYDGIHWGSPTDQTGGIFYAFSECVYPAVPPRLPVTQDVKTPPFIFQEDYTPGTGSTEISYITYRVVEPTITGVTEKSASFEVSQVYPNPASDRCAIELKSEKPMDIKAEICTLTGQVLQQVNPEKKNAGSQIIRFDVSNLENGVYAVKINAGNQTVTRKVVVL
jgi:hypothetical protein